VLLSSSLGRAQSSDFLGVSLSKSFFISHFSIFILPFESEPLIFGNDEK
jgi:hypothetical protein